MTDPIHEPELSRFVVPMESGEAVLEYSLSAGAVDFHHTFVPHSARGRGVAEALVRAGLGWARAEHRRVIPSCSYVASFLRRHPVEAGSERGDGDSRRGDAISKRGNADSKETQR